MFFEIIFCQEKQNYRSGNSHFQTNTINHVTDSSVDNKSESEMSFTFGIRDELIFMSVNIRNNQTNAMFLPINIHLIQGIRFLKYFNISFIVGLLAFSYDLNDDFDPGFDWGIFSKTKLFQTNIYAIIGIDFLSNNSSGGHGVTYLSTDNGAITLYCFGLGFEVSKNFSFDISHYVPQNTTFEYVTDIYHNLTYDKKLYGMTKFGFQYSFIF